MGVKGAAKRKQQEEEEEKKRGKEGAGQNKGSEKQAKKQEARDVQEEAWDMREGLQGFQGRPENLQMRGKKRSGRADGDRADIDLMP